MEVLKPNFCATSLIGIPITGPYHLLISMDTSYNTLLQTFPTIHPELKYIKGAAIFNFVENDIFKKSLSNKCMVKSDMHEYKKVVKILNALLPMLAEGFSIQHGALFDFESKANDSTGTFLNLYAASAAVKKTKQAPIYNLNEERTVGFITHEVNIRGSH